MSGGAAALVGLFWIAVGYVFPVWICVTRGAQRGRNGWIWGLLLGWIGVLMIFLLPPKQTMSEQIRSEIRTMGINDYKIPAVRKPESVDRDALESRNA
jgi:hypothetical protein